MNKFNRIPKEKEKEEDSSVKTNTFPTNAPFQRNTQPQELKNRQRKKKILEREKKTTRIALDTEHL